MKTTLKIGLMTLFTGIFVALSIPVRAAQPVDYWSVRGLTRPGAWFEKYNKQEPVTVAVSKSGKGIGEQKQTATKAGKKGKKQAASKNKGS